MTALRQRLRDDRQLRGLSPKIQPAILVPLESNEDVPEHACSPSPSSTGRLPVFRLTDGVVRNGEETIGHSASDRENASTPVPATRTVRL